MHTRLASIIAITLLLGIGIGLAITRYLMPLSAAQNTPTIQSTSYYNIDKWNTFYNPAIGYRLRYPDGIALEMLSNNGLDVVAARTDVPRSGQEGKVEVGGMSLLYRGDNGLESINEFSGISAERVTINGHQAKRLMHNTPYVDDIYVVDSDNKRVIRVSINTAGDKGHEENTYKLFYQMLMTLEFIP